MKGVEWITGQARFVAPRTVQVGDRLLTAQNVFLNVGSRASRPPLDGIDSVPTLDNVSVLELEEVPSHLVIVGGSYIGLEFAQVMRRFGAEVTVVERSQRFLPREDEDIAAEVQAILEDEGIRFRLGAECMAFERGTGGGIRMRVNCERGRTVRGGKPCAPGRGASTQHGRPRPGGCRSQHGCTRLCRSGRPVPHQCRRRLGDGRLQRAGRLHPHGLERSRDRRGPPLRATLARHRPAHSLLRAVHRSTAWPRRHDGDGGARQRPARSDRDPPHAARGPGEGVRRDARNDEGTYRCPDETHPGRGRSSV